MSGPLALQWSLDQTANTTLSLSRGLIAAATSDNVQPMALLACERFGATLDICTETCTKVESLVKTPTPVKSFLGAYIGYSAGDCATQLVKSVAGVQFLALAAALVSTTGKYHGSLALERLLISSARDKTSVPTARQLEDILRALEPRCVQSRFIDKVLYCRNLLLDYHWGAMQDPGAAKEYWKEATNYPDEAGVQTLLKALWALKNNDTINEVFLEITATVAAPWVIAFVQWCLGDFPTIDDETRTPIFHSATSKVTVIVTPVKNSPRISLVGIKMRGNIRHMSDIIHCDTTLGPWCGMVSIQQYGRWRREELNLELTLLSQVIPYAIAQVLAMWHIVSAEMLATSHQHISISLSGTFDMLHPCPFPATFKISDTITRFLGIRENLPIELPPGGKSFREMNLIQQHLQQLKGLCVCLSCDPDKEDGYSSQCHCDAFFDNIGLIVSDVLCLSLFEFSDSLLVSINTASRRFVPHSFPGAISRILCQSRRAVCSVRDIYCHALQLVDHSMNSEFCDIRGLRQFPIVSSRKGQVVYIKLFETKSLHRKGYMTMAWAPGVLRYNGKMYPYAREIISPDVRRPRRHRSFFYTVDIPRDLSSELCATWQIIQGDNESFLELVYVCQNTRNLRSFERGNANRILTNLAHSILLESCMHDSETPHPDPDSQIVYTLSDYVDPLKDSTGPETKVRCVLVNDNDALRLFALGQLSITGFSHIPAVIRGKACLECALRVCRKAKCHVLIL